MEIKDYGIIISSEDFRENDKLVKIYTKDNGLIISYAFGAKKSKKRFGGNLVPFNLSSFHLKRHKDYITIEEVRVIKYFPEITKSIINIKILFNVSALLCSQRGHWDTNLFKLLYFLLTNLNDAKEDNDRIKIYLIFCFYLLKKEGIINAQKICYICKDKKILFIASDNNSIYFKCPSCANEKELLVKIDGFFLEFFIQALNPTRTFLEQKFKKDALLKILSIIDPFLKRYFNVDIELLF
ncbi:MAG: DNA repair protein RecO [Proteobacteria bacterium]|nr:DNA repair protein RecO [Pseudomonadota bacterium]